MEHHDASKNKNYRRRKKGCQGRVTSDTCTQTFGQVSPQSGYLKMDDATEVNLGRGGDLDAYHKDWFETALEKNTWKKLGEALVQQWDSKG